MGALTKAQVDTEIAAGRIVILRNGDTFTLIDTAAESPASDNAINAGLTDLSSVDASIKENLAITDGKNIVLGTTTGTKVASAATQKMAFWGVTPVVQPAHANQGALTDSTGGTAGFTIADVTGSFSQSVLNNNFASVVRLLNRLRTDLVAAGIIKGAA